MSADLETHMEAAVEAVNFSKRGMKEKAKEAKVKTAAAKAADYFPPPGPRPLLLQHLLPRLCSRGLLLPIVAL